MATAVLERDIQDFKDLEVSASQGCESSRQSLFLRLSAVAGVQTKWQWIIHGNTKEYRQRVVRWLVREKRYTQARRFALCGRGDVGSLGDEENSVKLKPMGCGARFCPRCSRRFGRRFLSRVVSHLSSGPHGEMFHMVLTQRVRNEETLLQARVRFESSWKRFYRTLRSTGMSSALATYHVTKSDVGGWHYHCHVLVELVGGKGLEDVYDELDAAWWDALRDSSSKRKPLFCREVCREGGAFTGLEHDTQLEFWKESANPVEVVLQYVLRDVLQGVEGWIERLEGDEDCESFAGALASAKLHRCYGAWRKAVAVEEDDGEGDEEEGAHSSPVVLGKCKVPVTWTAVGSMDEVLWWAKTGQTASCELLRRLCGATSNRGKVGSRLLKLVREFAK